MRPARRWRTGQLRRLAEGYDAGVSVDDIAAALGTSRARVLHKARALELTHRSRRRRMPVPEYAPAEATGHAPAERPPIDDRNPTGPVARALDDLAGRVRETRDGFMLDRCPASVFRIIAAANIRRRALGMAPIRVGAVRRRAASAE